MIYDYTARNPKTPPFLTPPPQGDPGYAIHAETRDGATVYSLFTDDGRGNGEYVCETGAREWIDRIAVALDEQYYGGR